MDIPSGTLLASDQTQSIECSRGKGRDRSLHADLDSFKGTQRNISDELCGSTSREIERRLVLVGSFFASEVRVKLLEVLVASIFKCSLRLKRISNQATSRLIDTYRVPKECGAPSRKYSANSFCSTDLSPSLKISLVQFCIYLTTAFDQIHRGHCCMCNALVYL